MDDLTPDDIKAKLRDAGVPFGGDWSETEERTVKSPIIEKQKETLRKLESLVERQIATDQEKVADLHVALQRLKHGGGV
jgi:hypothetical protein